MKKLALITVGMVVGIAALAQTPLGNAATDSTPRTPPPIISTDRAAGTNDSVSMDQLAMQLQTLRASVEQTLPMLAEFNQRMANTNKLAGALSGLLSGVLGRKGESTSSVSSGQRLTNVLSALGSLVSTNSQGTVSINPDTLKALAGLQRDLQPVAEAMRNLNLGSTNLNSQPVGGSTPGGLTPTGR